MGLVHLGQGIDHAVIGYLLKKGAALVDKGIFPAKLRFRLLRMNSGESLSFECK